MGLDFVDLNKTRYNIHVFGDSHSRIYSSYYLPNYICNVYYTGAITMFRIGRDKPTLDQLKDLSKDYYNEYLPIAKKEYKHMSYPKNDNINDGDIVIFVFGEIDIRNHYAKQIHKGRDKMEVITNLVNNYINTVLENKSNYNNVKFGVQSINPPIDEKNLKESIKEYPIEGTIEERIEATLLINYLLKEKCKENDLLFIDTASYYQNDDTLYPQNGIDKNAQLYEMDTRIKDDNVHIHIDNPEGIDYAFKVANIETNLDHYKYKRKCKYPTPLNRYQRDFHNTIYKLHSIFVILMYVSLLLPVKYILFSAGLWFVLILSNLIIGKNMFDCFFNIFEFRNSNCNDIPLSPTTGLKLTDMYKLTIVLYVISIVTLIYKLRLFKQRYG
jgi:hypothetical protein